MKAVGQTDNHRTPLLRPEKQQVPMGRGWGGGAATLPPQHTAPSPHAAGMAIL